MISPKNFVDKLFEDEAAVAMAPAPGTDAGDESDDAEMLTRDEPEGGPEGEPSAKPDGRPSITDVIAQLKANGKADTSDEFLDAFIADYNNPGLSSEEFCKKYGVNCGA